MIFGSIFASGTDNKPVKRAAFAGAFYEADPGRLGREVEACIGKAGEAAEAGRVAVIIAPHAGYVYSGSTAGLAYAAVRGKRYDTVVIIGPSHRVGFSGCSIWPEGAFETPLGRVEVDPRTGQGHNQGLGIFLHREGLRRGTLRRGPDPLRPDGPAFGQDSPPSLWASRKNGP